jgi:hypothetical protein
VQVCNDRAIAAQGANLPHILITYWLGGKTTIGSPMCAAPFGHERIGEIRFSRLCVYFKLFQDN